MVPSTCRLDTRDSMAGTRSDPPPLAKRSGVGACSRGAHEFEEARGRDDIADKLSAAFSGLLAVESDQV